MASPAGLPSGLTEPNPTEEGDMLITNYFCDTPACGGFDSRQALTSTHFITGETQILCPFCGSGEGVTIVGKSAIIRTRAQRHVWERLEALNARHPDGWTADDLYMAAVLHHDLPGTLSEGTVRKLIREWHEAGLLGRKKFGRAVLWRLATV